MSFYATILHDVIFRKDSCLLYFSIIFRLLTMKGLGERDIFKACFQAGIP